MADLREQEKEKMDYGYGLVSTGADCTYLPFDAGRHRCIGEQFAYIQLTVVVTVMVREFRLRNPKGKIGVVATDYSVSTIFSLYFRALDSTCCSLSFRYRWSQQMSSGRNVIGLSESQGSCNVTHRVDVQTLLFQRMQVNRQKGPQSITVSQACLVVSFMP